MIKIYCFFLIGQILEREKSTHYLIILDSAPKNVILVDDNTQETYKDVIVAKRVKIEKQIYFAVQWGHTTTVTN